MIPGLYSAASGMEAQQTQLDALANDIANIDTPGYQSEQVDFHDLLYQNGSYSGADSGPVGTGAGAQVNGFNQAQGSILPTGQPLDVALSGAGYIEVSQAGGVGLTRNGTLQLNANGELTNNLGMVVQPPIRMPKGTDPSDVQISSNGTVSVKGHKLGQINIVTVPAPSQLIADGNGIFSPTVGSGKVIPARGTTVQQGSLEQSNVDANEAMTAMIQAQQSYDLASKAISFETQMAQIAATVKQ
jgi:flagellar basal-body rod protein FlgG